MRKTPRPHKALKSRPKRARSRSNQSWSPGRFWIATILSFSLCVVSEILKMYLSARLTTETSELKWEHLFFFFKCMWNKNYIINHFHKNKVGSLTNQHDPDWLYLLRNALNLHFFMIIFIDKILPLLESK